jgi:hypothetical protein
MDPALAERYVSSVYQPFFFDVIALVAAWGDVVHHKTGLRSSHMEIVALCQWFDPQDAKTQRLAEEMDVPFTDLNGLHALAKDMGVLCA